MTSLSDECEEQLGVDDPTLSETWHGHKALERWDDVWVPNIIQNQLLGTDYRPDYHRRMQKDFRNFSKQHTV